MIYKNTETIDASPEKVWSALFDDSSRPEGTPKLPPQEMFVPGQQVHFPGAGAAHKLVSRLATLHCVEFEKSRRLLVDCQQLFWKASFGCTLEPAAQQTLLTFEVSFKGPAMSFLRRRLEKPFSAALDKAMQKVKTQAEGKPDPRF